jgi:hypothetical protein
VEPRWLEAVRIRAYHIWESEGRPDGRALIHWTRALREMGLEMHQIDRLDSADSILTLLSLVDIEKLPPEERIALSTVQVETSINGFRPT